MNDALLLQCHMILFISFASVAVFFFCLAGKFTPASFRVVLKTLNISTPEMRVTFFAAENDNPGVMLGAKSFQVMFIFSFDNLLSKVALAKLPKVAVQPLAEV